MLATRITAASSGIGERHVGSPTPAGPIGAFPDRHDRVPRSPNPRMLSSRSRGPPTADAGATQSMATGGRRCPRRKALRDVACNTPSAVDATAEPRDPICGPSERSARDERDDPDRECTGDEQGDSDAEDVAMEAPSASAQRRTDAEPSTGLDARQAAAVGRCVNVQTQRRVDGREAAWRAWCGKKGFDVDPTVDKVREYLLDEWVDVGDDKKRRVCQTTRGPKPSRGCCAFGFSAGSAAPIRHVVLRVLHRFASHTPSCCKIPGSPLNAAVATRSRHPLPRGLQWLLASQDLH